MQKVALIVTQFLDIFVFGIVLPKCTILLEFFPCYKFINTLHLSTRNEALNNEFKTNKFVQRPCQGMVLVLMVAWLGYVRL